MFGIVLLIPVTAAGAAPGSSFDFFEARIRPVLVEHWYECHSSRAERSGKLKGSLRLDDRSAVRRGGESGPALAPGKPEESRLLQALRQQSLEMPPAGKLPDAVIADFAKWIAMGAPDPRESTAAGAEESPALEHPTGGGLWSLALPRPTEPPAVRNVEQARTAIDRFVLSKLESAGLSYSPPAERRVLIRRAMLDLWGIPPTYAQVEQFAGDPAPDAYDRLIDRLLASPMYGERWGRHWLDVARYADTKGYVFTEEIRYPYAYTYRDYVIGAFNADLPFDRFVTE